MGASVRVCKGGRARRAGSGERLQHYSSTGGGNLRKPGSLNPSPGPPDPKPETGGGLKRADPRCKPESRKASQPETQTRDANPRREPETRKASPREMKRRTPNANPKRAKLSKLSRNANPKPQSAKRKPEPRRAGKVTRAGRRENPSRALKTGANQIVIPLDKPQWIVAQWPLSTHTIPGTS